MASVARQAHDPQAWVAWFRECCQKRATHPPRLEIGRQTQEVVKAGRYGNVDIDGLHEAAAGTTVWQCREGDGGAGPSPPVQVVNQDCVEAALLLQDRHPGEQVLLLNMGAPCAPGMGPQGAQEENLHRRSGLRLCTAGRGELYPIPDDGCLYHPLVPFFRGSEDAGYPFLPAPRKVSVVTVAAVRLRRLQPFTDVEADATRIKVRAVLQAAVAHGHRVLVLSALGCGAFHNPADKVAVIFREELCRAEFAGVFKEVAFAIIEDHNSGGVNGRAFAEAFGVPLKQRGSW